MQRMDHKEIAQGLRDRLITRDTLQPHQKPPADEDWTGWVLLAGRGAGKSYAGMRWLNDQALAIPGLRARIVAPTFGDGVASCVNGPNGLLTLSNGLAKWKPSEPGGACISYPNGATVWVIGTPTLRDVDRLRALTNIEIDVFEEAFANTMLQQAWDQATLSRRQGKNPRVVVTSTPRPHPLIKKWEKNPRFHISRAISRDNKFLEEDWLQELETAYKGTRLYRQEVLGEVVEDVEGALWKLTDIERSSVPREGLELERVVVGVDPPSGQGTCGIVVVGRDAGGHIYVLDDYSISEASPNQWATRAAAAAAVYDALVVAEVNQGGQMVTAVMRQVSPDLAISTVVASKGKQTRAEPVAQRWEADLQTAHMAPTHAGRLLKLVTQMTEWVPGEGDSPDRVDALVWAATYLKKGRTAVVRSPGAVVRSVRDEMQSGFRDALRGRVLR